MATLERSVGHNSGIGAANAAQRHDGDPSISPHVEALAQPCV
jgi:hypothetical protein